MYIYMCTCSLCTGSLPQYEAKPPLCFVCGCFYTDRTISHDRIRLLCIVAAIRMFLANHGAWSMFVAESPKVACAARHECADV